MKNKLKRVAVTIMAVVGILSTGMVAFAAEDYTVVKDDYLKKIAKQAYGDEAKWNLIYEANSDKIKNPNLIYVGQVLTIPSLDEVSNGTVTTPEPVQEQPIVEAPTPTPEAMPAPETASAPVEASAPANSMSVEDANGYVAMMYSSFVSQLPDSILSFFDTDNNMIIDKDEQKDCFFWLISNYNPQKKTELSQLSDEEKIAIATAILNGGVQVPADLFHTTK